MRCDIKKDIRPLVEIEKYGKLQICNKIFENSLTIYSRSFE